MCSSARSGTLRWPSRPARRSGTAPPTTIHRICWRGSLWRPESRARLVVAATLTVVLGACAPYVAPWEFTTGEDIAEAERVAALLAERSGLPLLGNADLGSRKGIDRAANAR